MHRRNSIFLLITVMAFAVFGVAAVFADDYAGSQFIVRDPVTIVRGDRQTSTNFEYYSSTGQTVIGENTSTNFIGRSGFQYYSITTSAVVTPTAGDTQVALSWTTAVANGGESVASYAVGQSTTSGGPYTYTALGNVLASTRTGLSNGTTYYFVVQARNASGLNLSQSAQVSATPAGTPPVTPPGGGGGGGGGGGPAPTATSATFSGRAYPTSVVTLLKDAQVVATTIAGADANFTISLSNLTAGNYIFSVYSEDGGGRRSSLLSFPVGITAGANTTVSGIFIAPTIAVDKEQVKRGDNVAIFGQSAPSSEITISVHSNEEQFVKTNSDPGGVYLFNFDTAPLEDGQHLTKSKAAKGTEISSYGPTVAFAVGATNVAATPTGKCGKADLNCDGKVNLIDFSIAAFWYKRVLSADFAKIEAERLNADAKITLVDFSIMAFYWTG